ncbi:GNAT family N-acetyltransferase [Clostridiaceae bacterium UIB06]|uniref:GNAT family N-acetyltransferase n=1 Tax=Clostridium thailandense TaxID=2794346 RepID=A0A949WVN6_9CLOT|nr:GNAT family N-acetyltransferase [Clostridium thailandense]MBV7273892.1 GNAT family N-acetyltransferase [Clostridium thailandense]MCH5136927.1 GNAT family N-acetyltransferase [Clostridiaceae bacterium UIB06]
MNIKIKAYDKNDVAEAIYIWNEVVQDGIAFPQMDLLTEGSGDDFFSHQSFTGIAYDMGSKEIVGLYILHPNNLGRCGHICNASYAVKKGMRGHHIGEKLVIHCMDKAKELGFKILQFNAVVKSNEYALRLYEKLGFVKLGIIPNGFLMKDGTYEDIIPHYRVL